MTLDMNCQVAPFDNPAVRRALKLAIDREDIITKVFLGEAARPAMTIRWQRSCRSGSKRRPNIAMIPMLPALLAEAEVEGPVVDLSVADLAFPGAIEAGVLFREHAAKPGSSQSDPGGR